MEEKTIEESNGQRIEELSNWDTTKAAKSLPSRLSAEENKAPRGKYRRHVNQALSHAWLCFGLSSALPLLGRSVGAVAIAVKDGVVIYEGGYGLADVAQGSPMDTKQTVVRLGSISKLFTAVAVMQFVERGKLDLDVDVREYLDLDSVCGLREESHPPASAFTTGPF